MVKQPNKSKLWDILYKRQSSATNKDHVGELLCIKGGAKTHDKENVWSMDRLKGQKSNERAIWEQLKKFDYRVCIRHYCISVSFLRCGGDIVAI